MAAVASRVVGTVGRRRVEPDLSTYAGRLAARIRELREAKNLKVHELADKLGVSAARIYAYESGEREIPTDLYPPLAKALGCKTVADFFPPLK